MKLKSAAKWFTIWLVILPTAAVLAIPMFWAEIWIAGFIGQKWVALLLIAPGKWIDDFLVHIHLIPAPAMGGHFPDLRFLLFHPIPLNIAILSWLLYKISKSSRNSHIKESM